MEKKNWAIVDDDAIFHLTTQAIIERKDVHDKILLFWNGKQAIDYFFKHKNNNDMLPDVVLLDINMPIMNGWDFIEEYIPLKIELPKQVIIYIVTSSVDKNDIQRAEELPDIKSFIIKPIDSLKFERIIDDLIAA